MYSYPYPLNNCSGMIFHKSNPRIFNMKQYKLPASSFTTQKKVLAVTEQFGQAQTTNNNNNCKNGLAQAITNIGGPGNIVSHNGLDKKHNHYDRYLARKKGWILRSQYCNDYNNKVFSTPPIAPSVNLFPPNDGGDNNAGDNNAGDNNGGDNNAGDNNAGDNNAGDNNAGDNNGGDDYYGDDAYDNYY